MNIQKEKYTRAEAFVLFIIDRINRDKGIAAQLRRADNPATEYQCWDQLALFNIDLEKSSERLPYATIAAALAKGKIERNGNMNIGAALASCYEEGSNSDQAKSKLRRLLACESVGELCRILRPLFSMIISKSNHHLNYAQLLNDLLLFNFRKEQIKSRWAQNFYKGEYRDVGAIL